MEKKGAVSLSTKVIIGLVVGIPIVIIILLVGAKVVSLVLSFPKPDDESFNELINIIKNLKDKEEEIGVTYFINQEHFLIGFDEDTEIIKKGGLFGSGDIEFKAPINCINKEDEYGVCICKCDKKESACKISDCELIENKGLYYIECIGCDKEYLFVEGKRTLLLDLEREGHTLKFIVRIKGV